MYWPSSRLLGPEPWTTAAAGKGPLPGGSVSVPPSPGLPKRTSSWRTGTRVPLTARPVERRLPLVRSTPASGARTSTPAPTT